jgi:hypothetical protein
LLVLRFEDEFSSSVYVPISPPPCFFWNEIHSSIGLRN